MSMIRRLADSCLLVTTATGTTLFDPGFFTWDSGEVDLETIGDVQRVLITHEHGDHVKPEFVRWLIDRGTDVEVYSNEPVRKLLAVHDIEVLTSTPGGVTFEDVTHGLTPMGTAPPNRSWTIDGLFTHPGDSYEVTASAQILALPLLVLWGSTTASVAFARRLAPRQVVMTHDFYMSSAGREFLMTAVKGVLASDGIELVPLGWGDGYSI